MHFDKNFFLFFFSDNLKMKPEQQEWIKSSINVIYELINNTPPDGIRFSEVVKNILKVFKKKVFNL